MHLRLASLPYRRLSVTAILLVPLGAGGQTSSAPADTPPPITFTKEVSVTARAREAIGATVTVIDRETIDASNVRSVAELVRDVAGVRVVSSGTRGGNTNAQIRGGDPNFTVVLLDGIPLNDPTNLEGGSFNLEAMPISSVERIEIGRGPHSYFFGSSALAGVINIVSRRGTSVGPQAELMLEAGEASELRGNASLSADVGRADYFVSVGWEEEEERIASESFEQLHVQAGLGFEFDARSSLRLTARLTDTTTDDYPEASGGPELGSGELRSTENQGYSVGANLTLDGDRWNHAMSASIDRKNVDRSSPAIAFQVPPSVEDRTYTRSRLGWLSRFSVRDDIGFTAGVDVEREDATNESTLLLPPEFGGSVSGDYDLTRTTPGLFAEVGWDWRDLAVVVGARADIPEDLSTEWSPRVAVRYGFGDSGVKLRGSWGRAFKLPSFFALASSPALGGNPDLLPETSVGVDLGLEFAAPSGTWSAGAVLFENRYEDLIDFDFDSFKHVNRSEVTATGLELFGHWTPVPEVTLRADLTFQDVDHESSPDRPLNKPSWFGSARITWRPCHDIALKLAGRFADESFDRQLTVPERDTVDGYFVTDIAATWTLARRWQILGHIDNLTNEHYEHFIGFPAPPRSVRLGLRLRLERGDAPRMRRSQGHDAGGRAHETEPPA